MLLGHRTVCAVEIEPYCRKVLLQRQRDGILPWFPIWDDVRTFDGKPWRGIADVVCGGFPCQDISIAGPGGGIEESRSGLWREMARIIGEVQPTYAYVENSPMLVGRGLAMVLGDLAEMGFDAKWCVLGADDLGGPHERKRIWILATNTEKERCSEVFSRGVQQNADRSGAWNGRSTAGSGNALERWGWKDWASVANVDDGLAGRMGELAAIGNGQVPIVAATAWEILST
jgi:DNA (cytosine-5)-methyltransferase 1